MRSKVDKTKFWSGRVGLGVQPETSFLSPTEQTAPSMLLKRAIGTGHSARDAGCTSLARYGVLADAISCCRPMHAVSVPPGLFL